MKAAGLDMCGARWLRTELLISSSYVLASLIPMRVSVSSSAGRDLKRWQLFLPAGIRAPQGERLDGVAAKYNAKAGGIRRFLIGLVWKTVAKGLAPDAAEEALDEALVKHG